MDELNKESSAVTASRTYISLSQSKFQQLLLKIKFPTSSVQIQTKFILYSAKCDPAGIYMFKVNNRNTRTRFEICSKLTIKTPERRQWGKLLLFTFVYRVRIWKKSDFNTFQGKRTSNDLAQTRERPCLLS